MHCFPHGGKGWTAFLNLILLSGSLQQMTVLKAQAGVKNNVRRLNKSIIQHGSNHIVQVVVFALICFFVVYLWAKMSRKWGSAALLWEVRSMEQVQEIHLLLLTYWSGCRRYPLLLHQRSSIEGFFWTTQIYNGSVVKSLPWACDLKDDIFD